MEEKSCFKCRNQNICKHKSHIFDKFELCHVLNDISGFINIIAKSIGERCRYFTEYTEKEKEIFK